MAELPANIFTNPVWSALHSQHRHFAVSAGSASRYPADIAPFIATATPTVDAFEDVPSLLSVGELVYLIGESYPHVQQLSFGETFGVLQMALPPTVQLPEDQPAQPKGNRSAEAHEIVELGAANADEMVALTTLAFPGYFRKRTCEMGKYYGVRSDGELIAMAGERLMHDGYAEISGVCTHPAHRAKGLAASLMWKLVRSHRAAGIASWLHVGNKNERAVGLYQRMGFEKIREVTLHPITRKS